MISKFGEYIRKIRKDDTLMTMANKLEMSIVDLSAMEVGRKVVPSELVDKIAFCYHLSTSEKKELYSAATLSNEFVEEELLKMNLSTIDTSLKLSRKIIYSSDELIERLKKVISNG